MNREEYLAKLRHYLKKLPQAEYENAMEHFTEYFDEAGAENEAKVIEELGSPKEAASELLKNLLEEKTTTDDHKSPVGAILLIAVMILLLSPAGLPYILPGLLSIFAVLVVILFLVLLSLGMDITLISASLDWLVNGIARIPYSLPGACVMFGAGMFGLGACILLNMLFICFCKCLLCILQRLIQKIAKK